ncbi:MAG: hypothetical protein H6Q72_912 [Firmicutes bacterium]|nr:hypothetical protein [Bacillota bacterium]
MNELIRVDENGKITARELYEFLSPDDKSHYSRWTKTNIEQNEFYQESIDWLGFAIVANGNETKEYRLTIDFAKHLCMLSRSERGKQARSYFVEVEKQFKLAFRVPQTLPEALRLAAQAIEEKEQAVKQLEAAKPKVEFYDAVTGSKDAIEIGEAAKVLNIPGVGRNKLFQELRNRKILMNNNQPYQEYVDRGYFRVLEQKYNKPNGDICINIKTLVYQKGLDYIRRLLTKDNVINLPA